MNALGVDPHRVLRFENLGKVFGFAGLKTTVRQDVVRTGVVLTSLTLSLFRLGTITSPLNGVTVGGVVVDVSTMAIGGETRGVKSL
jgi:hypothetical protein